MTDVAENGDYEEDLSMSAPQSFTLEEFALRSYTYFDGLVDREGYPYFNVFWDEPASAAHDWPDYGDVMSRQLQGAIMGRRMTGRKAGIEDTWRRNVRALIEDDGLLYRPAVPWAGHYADMGDNALTLYALATQYADDGDAETGRTLRRATDTLLDEFRRGTQRTEGLLGGFATKSFMAIARALNYEPAFELAGIIVHRQFDETRAFSPDNTFRHGGHMHGALHSLLGAADYALAARAPILFSRIDALYRYVRSESTRFGFLPEVIGRQGDVVLCETCALMDYLGLAATLANAGHPEYWDDVERVVRNQLAESQVMDAAWLTVDNSRADTNQFTWRDVDKRIVGAWSGWSSPTHILAARETLHWGGPELRGRTRALQNCCGGSGVHALFIAWKNASRFHREGAARSDNGTLSVNLHMDKLLPEGEVRCEQPYRGVTRVTLRKPCRVRVRIPGFLAPRDLALTVGGVRVEPKVWGNYVEIDERPAGETIILEYPLPLLADEAVIGNPGWRQYRYQVTWKGDTVIRMSPLGDIPATGWSDFEKDDVPIFYGKDGPGPLYRRDHFLRDAQPEPAPIHEDDGGIDFWNLH